MSGVEERGGRRGGRGLCVAGEVRGEWGGMHGGVGGICVGRGGKFAWVSR